MRIFSLEAISKIQFSILRCVRFAHLLRMNKEPVHPEQSRRSRERRRANGAAFLRSHLITKSLLTLLISLCATEIGLAQGFGKPLAFQGLDHMTAQSAGSRAYGGITVGSQGDIGLMFANPASLQGLTDLQISVGGLRQTSETKQVQQYGPLNYYTNFSLLMEGLTGLIQDPRYDTSVHSYNAGDTIQRPFDNIGPNWSRSKAKNMPMQIFAAMPFSVSDVKFSAGLGAIQYANLDWYFQNNNVLSPSILSVDPFTTPIPKNNTDSAAFPVQWYQYYQRRTGSIYGYGGALSASVSEKIALGISAMILKGNSDDKESRMERGRLRFYQSYFRLEPVSYHVVSTGTSDFSGVEITVSGSVNTKYLGIGFSIKPPTTITRKYSGQTQLDTTGASRSTSYSGEEKMVIPLRGSAGASITLRENLKLGMEYEMHPYSSAEYQSSNGSKSNPWLSSNLFHVGVEYSPMLWLTLRGGAREMAEVFEPVGNPLGGDPVSYTAFTFGAGVKFDNMRFNVAYEYATIKYVDEWAGALSINTQTPQSIVADITYEIPW